MLNHGHKVSVSRPISSAWTEDEWDLIGKEFMRLHPHWQTTKFMLEDVEDVMESVIPQGKHRSFETLDDLLPQLFNSFHRLQKIGYKPEKIITKEVANLAQRIRWTPKEWEEVVLQFNLDHPGAFEQRLAKITLRDVKEASDILPLARQRNFHHIGEFREQALKCWDEISPEVRFKDGQTRAVKEFSSGLIIEPTPLKSDANSALATAMHKAFQAPEKPEPVAELDNGKRKKSVHWDDSEWLKVCQEMRRQNPHANYLTSSFSKIELAAIKAAQRVALPFERHKALKQPGGLQGPLCKTFRIIKAMLEEEKAKDAFQDVGLTEAVQKAIEAKNVVKEPAPAPVVVAEKVPTLAPEPAPVAEVVQAVVAIEAPQEVPVEEPIRALFQQAAKQEIAEQFQAGDFFGKMAKAALPMVDVIVDEVASRVAARMIPGLISQMMPELTKAMFPMLENAIADLKRAAMPIYVPSVAQPAPALYTHAAHVEAPVMAPVAAPVDVQEVYKIPVVKTVKKPLIAMLGPLGNQISELEAAFPEFSFAFIQNGHGIREAAAKAEVFIVSNKYLNGANRQNIKKYVAKEKVRFIDGGMTSYKHLINAWKAENFKQFQ